MKSSVADYRSRCRVSNSPQRVEAERRRLQGGWSDRRVAEWMKRQGAVVSYEAVRLHFKNHMDIQASARREYEASKQLAAEETRKRVTEIERLDDAIERAAGILEVYHPKIVAALEGDEKISTAEVTAGVTAFADLRQLIMARAKLLGVAGQDEVTELLIQALTSEPEASA